MSNESSSTINPRPGLEVFENKAGNISISQIGGFDEEVNGVVVVHPDDVPRLIEILQKEKDRISKAG